MSGIDHLDPATLRWVADDHAARAERLSLTTAHSCDVDLYGEWAHADREEARRLRALATRIERKRTAALAASIAAFTCTTKETP